MKDTIFCKIHDELNLQIFRTKNYKPLKQNYRYPKNELRRISNDIIEVEKSMSGEWGYQHSKGLFSWIFTKDSIEYIHWNKKFYYQRNDNNVIVLTDEEPVIMKNVLIKEDTIYFTTEDSIFIKAHKIH